MPIPQLDLLVPEIIVVSLALIALSLDLILPKSQKTYIAYVSLMGLAAALVASVVQIGDYGMTLNDGFSADALTAFVRVAAIALFMILIIGTLRSSTVEEGPGEYYGLFLFSLTGALFMAGASDMISLYLGLELSALPAYVLVAFQKNRPKSGEAALKYFLIGIFASLMLVYGMTLVFGFTGEIQFNAIATQLKEGQPALLLAIFLLLGGFGFKVTAFPFHFWAPDAYDGASAPVAGYLASIVKIAAFAAIIRMFMWALPFVQAEWAIWFSVLAYVTMTAGNLLALPQTNIKRLLAYSSISQAGYALIGVAVGTKLALSMTMFFLMTYGIGTVGAFLVVAALSNGKEADGVADYRGLAQRSPMLAIALVIFLLSLVGIPPLAGFVGKLFLFGAAIDGRHFGLAIAGGINTVISMGYYVKVMKAMHVDEPVQKSRPDVPVQIRWAIYLAIFATLGVGVYFGPLLTLARQIGRLF
ncbi:MAG: NADH-quinone oxidoreductase subunit N [Terriglobia bacterium]